MRGLLRTTAGGLPTTFWYLWTGTLVNRAGSFVIIFLAIYLTTARGFSQSQAGLVLGLGGVGGAVGTMVGGILADRWGRRPTLLLAHVGGAGWMLMLGFTRDLWTVAAGVLLLSLFTEGARPAFAAMVVDVVPERDRMRAFSLNYWAINLGFALAAVLAGLAAQYDYLLLFVIDAATTLITATIVLLRVRETRPTGVRVTAALPSTGGIGTVLRDRVFLAFVALNLPVALIFLQHLSTLPIAMAQDGLSPATFGWVIALNGLLIVAGQLFVPRLVRDRNRSHVLAVAALVIGGGFGLTALAEDAWLYAVTVLVWTMGEMLHAPSNSALLAELAPAELRGRYQGVFSLSWSAAAFLAPTLGGLVQEHVGNATLWIACAVLGAAVAVATLASGPARERRAAALRPPPDTASPALEQVAQGSPA